MSDIVFPSDAARAESDDLNRVCEYLERFLDEREALETENHRQAAEIERLKKRFAQIDAGVDEFKQMMSAAMEDLERERDRSHVRLKASNQALSRLVSRLSGPDRKYARRIYADVIERDGAITVAAHDAEVIRTFITLLQHEGHLEKDTYDFALIYLQRLCGQAGAEPIAAPAAWIAPVDGVDLDELEKAALAATPGPWRHHIHHYPISESDGHFVVEAEEFGDPLLSASTTPTHPDAAANCAFVAAANPAIVLELIRRLRQAEGGLAKSREISRTQGGEQSQGVRQ